MNISQEANTFDVIIIGGGITGAGTARDCALRGLKVLVVERADIADGATGRNHGLLHSGARYAVTDEESARECIEENKILKRIANHCVEDTYGYFITLPEDSLDYQDEFVRACTRAGIEAEKVDPKQALSEEPAINPSIVGAVKVPDGAIDPFRLCSSNIIDAISHGAVLALYSEVISFIKDAEGTIQGVEVFDKRKNERRRYYAPVTVNAAGIWGAKLAQLAGVKLRMFPSKGSLLVFAHRINNIVINRCRKPANADILVPGDTVSIIGTTSERIPFEECGSVRVNPSEVDELLREGALLAPALSQTRILRAYAGVRPLVSSSDDPTGRSISRGIVLLDHEKQDGVKGFITITGGKLMTYRLMAEKTADLVCKKLNINAVCQTHKLHLPGSGDFVTRDLIAGEYQEPMSSKAAVGRMGDRAVALDKAVSNDIRSLVCECESVSVAEVKMAIGEFDTPCLSDLRRRTRVGMGTCQGTLCACRAAGILSSCKKGPGDSGDLEAFLAERWKGMSAIPWGDTLREGQYGLWLYRQVLGIV